MTIDEEIQEVIEENDRLQLEISKLKGLLNLKEYEGNEKSSLEEFYAEVYLRRHNNILDLKIKDIDKDIISKKLEKQSYYDEDDALDDKVLDSKEYVETYNSYKDEKYKLIADVEILNKRISSLEEKIDELSENIVSASLSTINRLENKLIDGNYNSIINDIESSVKYQIMTVYPLILVVRENKIELDNLNKTLDELTKRNETEIVVLEDKMNTLLYEMTKDIREELHNMISECEESLDRIEKLKKELTDTFDAVRDSNLKEIVDKINYYRLTDTSNDEISKMIEETIDSMIDKLKSQETMFSLRVVKELRLAQLTAEIDDLKAKKKELDAATLEYEKLSNSYNKVTEILNNLNEYVRRYQLAIENNHGFEIVLEKYLTIVNELNENQLEADDINQSLLDKKQYINECISNGESPEYIDNLKDEYYSVKDTLEKLETKIAYCKGVVEEIESNAENYRLIVCYKDKQEIEKKIPVIIGNLKSLKYNLDVLKDKIDNLNTVLSVYDSKVAEVERINDELNNR